MKTQSNVKPEAVKIAGEWLILTENVSEIQREEETLYEYDEYRMKITPRKNLQESVERNIEAWLAKAKQEEYDNLANVVRTRRNELLAATDFYALSDRVMPKEVEVYRQTLRDITKQEGFPKDVKWPEVL